MRDAPVERVVDLVDPAVNRIDNMSLAQARERVATGRADAVRGDRRLLRAGRAGRGNGAAGAVARPAAALFPRQARGGAGARRRRTASTRSTRYLAARGTRRAVPSRATRGWCPRTTSSRSSSSGCPDPDADLHAVLHPERATAPADRDRSSGARYVGALAREIARWLRGPSRARAGRRLLLRRRRQRRRVPRGLPRDGEARDEPGPLKAFTLSAARRRGPRAGPRGFSSALGLGCSSSRSRPTPARSTRSRPSA